MTAIERKFFIVCGKIDLLADDTSEDFARMDTLAETLIPTVAYHYSALSNRDITADEWIDITIDPDSDQYPDTPLRLGDDWEQVKAILVLMASELYSKVGANGLDDLSEGGLSQTFSSNYSKGMIALINSQKRLRTF
jgi:hypothetical protein